MSHWWFVSEWNIACLLKFLYIFEWNSCQIAYELTDVWVDDF